MEYHAQLRKTFKASARQSIRGNFWTTMGVSVLMLIPSCLISVVYQLQLPDGIESFVYVQGMGTKILLATVTFLLALVFVCVPIEFGAKRYFVACARGQTASLGMIFSCFGNGKSYVTSIKLAIAILFRSLGWYILEMAIGAVAGLLFVGFDSHARVSAVNVFVIAAAAAVLAAVSLWIGVKIRRYDGAYIRVIDEPQLGAWKATGECADAFRNHNWELVVFDFSFIGWILLTVVTLGIAGIYYYAYVEIAFVNYFDTLRCNEMSR